MKISIDEVDKLFIEIVNYFFDLLKIEHPDDVSYRIINDTEQCGSITYKIPHYLISSITINICEVRNEDEIISEICHELAHVLLIEYTEFFHTWIGYKDENKPSFKCFKRAEERTAMRIGRLMENMWRNK